MKTTQAPQKTAAPPPGMNSTNAAETSIRDRLFARISLLTAGLGYELVYLEVLSHRQHALRIFIDLAPPGPGNSGAEENRSVGIEDCVKVSRALDEPLESAPEIEELFRGTPYELEVSSPGVDRPLRSERDYTRFSGRQARLNVYRPLTADELGDSSYQARNPKQKTFVGTLLGIDGLAVRLRPASGSIEIRIPLALVSKANLEPEFDFDRKPEGLL